MGLLRLPAVHAAKIERWLGREQLASLLANSRGFRHPVPVLNVPGAVLAYDGDLVGGMGGGAGFSSLSDLIAEATVNGKRQDWFFSKAGSLAVSGAWASLWNVGNFPAAGGTVPAIPGGAVPTSATTGAIPFTNAASGDTLHIITPGGMGSAAPNTLLLYDRIFHAGSVLHTTTGNQSVTGTPNRYTGTSSPGNFAFLEVTSALGTTAHNLTMTYVDQSGNAAEAAAALAMVTSSAVTRIPHTPWFVPLNSGDSGLRNVTNIAFSAVSSGTSAIVLGHALAFLPQPVANSWVVLDGINSAFSMVRVLDNACIAFLELKGVATATTYHGHLILVSG